MNKQEIIKNIHDRLENVAALTPFERTLIQYAVEETMKLVKSKEGFFK
jgi:hypothetical protein